MDLAPPVTTAVLPDNLPIRFPLFFARPEAAGAARFAPVLSRQ
jgi:hypothetical protein